MKRLILLITCLLLISAFTIPVFAVTPKITDDYDLLTPEEEAILEKMASRVATQYEADVAIHTVDSIGMKSVGEYADDYYDEQGYGFGDHSSGIILVICMDQREIYISTCGPCGYSIDDYEVEEILDGVYEHMANGDYFQACKTFINQTEMYLDAEKAQGDPGKNAFYKDYGSEKEDAGFDVGNAAVSVLVGAGGGGVGLAALRSGMNTAVSQYNAQGYIDSNSYQLTVNQNTFLYSNVTRVRRSTSQSSGGRAGGSMHQSSGGKIHGGGGRKF